MTEKTPETNTWPELFVGLYERLTGNNAEISYSFDNFQIGVPASTAKDAPHAMWKFNGVLKITTREVNK